MLLYGQHPQRAMPTYSWPKYGRVGGISSPPVVSRVRGRSAGIVVGVTPEARRIVDRRREDQLILEFIQIIVTSGVLE